SFSSTLLFTLPPTNRLFISDKKWVSKLGIYTYGLYLFHTIIINLFHQVNTLAFSWPIFTVITLMVTILVSMVSYHIFEKQFLKLKTYFY
ncbi:MAG: hypothetical protein N2662_07370, partial [Bacteroidales bacterium]|nr:hypothetical protein [Bacteroidales bacterium]